MISHTKNPIPYHMYESGRCASAVVISPHQSAIPNGIHATRVLRKNRPNSSPGVGAAFPLRRFLGGFGGEIRTVVTLTLVPLVALANELLNLTGENPVRHPEFERQFRLLHGLSSVDRRFELRDSLVPLRVIHGVAVHTGRDRRSLPLRDLEIGRAHV